MWLRGSYWPRARLLQGTLDSIAEAHRVRDRQLNPVLEAFAVADAGQALEPYAASGDTTAALAQVVESIVNGLGYQLLRRGQVDSALAAFILNTESFPRASNTWDSLGEAYLVKGDTVRAVRNYEKSLELNPGNDNARAYLARLKGRG